LVALLWPLGVALHLHWSGYGLTGYLWWMDWLRPLMSGVAGLNAYNIPEGCGLALCGYPLSWLMHGVAVFLVGLTINLCFKDLDVWKEFGLTSLTIWAAIIWEWWEIWAGVTTLRPELFATIEQATSEGMRLITDTVNDILVGAVFLWAFLIVISLLDHHFGFEYVEAPVSLNSLARP